MANDIQKQVMIFPQKKNYLDNIPNRWGHMLYAFETPEIGNLLFFICF